MRLSLLTVPWLLATSISAIPVQSKGGNISHPVDDTGIIAPELNRRPCLHPEAQSVQEGGIQACNPLPTDEASLESRDLKKGTFSKEEYPMLQAASEKDVNFFHLMDSLMTLSKILDGKRIPWAVAGGLTLKIHGQQRYTSDIDIVVQTDMIKLKAALAKDKKFIVPGFAWPSNVHLRVYHNQGSDAKPKYIELDMIIAGELITPADLGRNSIDKEKKTKDGKALNVHVLKLGKIFRSKVFALAASWRNKDDKDMADISWIIEKTPGALKNVEKELAYDMRQLVIYHLEKRSSPLLQTARQLLKVQPNQPTHLIQPQPIQGVPQGQENHMMQWLFNGVSTGNTPWG